jgi:hypothetical protein
VVRTGVNVYKVLVVKLLLVRLQWAAALRVGSVPGDLAAVVIPAEPALWCGRLDRWRGRCVWAKPQCFTRDRRVRHQIKSIWNHLRHLDLHCVKQANGGGQTQQGRRPERRKKSETCPAGSVVSTPILCKVSVASPRKGFPPPSTRWPSKPH